MRLFILISLLFSYEAISEINVSGTMGGVNLPTSCKAGDQGISIDLKSKLITFYCGSVKYDCQTENIDNKTLAILNFNTAKFSLKCNDMSRFDNLTLSINSYYETLNDYNNTNEATNPCETGCKIVNYSYDEYYKLLSYFTDDGQQYILSGCFLQENDKPVFVNEYTISVYACVNGIDTQGNIITTNGDIIFNNSFDG